MSVSNSFGQTQSVCLVHNLTKFLAFYCHIKRSIMLYYCYILLFSPLKKYLLSMDERPTLGRRYISDSPWTQQLAAPLAAAGTEEPHTEQGASPPGWTDTAQVRGEHLLSSLEPRPACLLLSGRHQAEQVAGARSRSPAAPRCSCGDAAAAPTCNSGVQVLLVPGQPLVLHF